MASTTKKMRKKTMSNVQKPKEFKPQYTCPNGCGEKFDTQNKLIQHALPCKRGELDR